MKIRKIDYCNLTLDIASDPTKDISEYLPGKQMFTIVEYLLYKNHIQECKDCDRISEAVVEKAPKISMEDNIKNEN